MLFDFSLSSAAGTAVTAGTPPYLDPFLDSPRRGRYDSAAERYSAAVVLFEMATGSVPRFGDGLSDPASVQDEAAVEPGMFDPAVADSLTGFFRTALARDARQRHDTAAEMLAAWQSVFQPVPRTVPDDAEDLAAKAEVSTPLARAGLSARALSAIEPLAVSTVGDLVAVDPVRLNHLSGVSTATRGEIKARAREWRNRFGAAVTGRGSGHAASARPGTTALPDPVTAAGLLVEHAGSARAESRRALARLLLGLDPRHRRVRVPDRDRRGHRGNKGPGSAAVRRAAGRVGCRRKLHGTARHARRDRLAVAGRLRLRRHGGRAGAVGARGHAARGRRGRRAPPWTGSRRACCGSHWTGSRRCNVRKAMRREFFSRRRDGRIVLLAADQALLDPAEALGRAADDLVAQAAASGEHTVPAARAAGRLLDVWTKAVRGLESPPSVPDTGRLLRLAAALARDAALAGSGDLYTRTMPATAALTIALGGRRRAAGRRAGGPRPRPRQVPRPRAAAGPAAA